VLDRPAAELVRARRSACIGPQALCPVGNGAGHLSQFLSHSPLSGAIHQRPPRSCSGRSRTVADAGERWPALLESVLGQPLASSNLASSATLTCYDALGLRSRAVPCPTARVSFSVSVWVLAICLIPDKSVWWCAEMTHVVPGQGCRGRTSMEPRTPLKRAHRRSGQAGTVRRPGCRLLLHGAGASGSLPLQRRRQHNRG